MSPVVDQSCPYLGLADDPETRFAYPSSAQRCHATDRPSAVDAAKQAQDCLTAHHLTCPRYRPLSVEAPAGRHLRELVASPALAKARPTRISRTRSAADWRPRSRRAVSLALFAVLLVAAGGGGLMIGSRLAGWLAGGSPGASASAGALNAPSPSVSAPTATATPTPTPTLAPTPSPTPTPTATPTRTPVPTPLIHVVTPGETLTQIAARYGVTVAALQTANKITDPGVILVGQQLIIPSP